MGASARYRPLIAQIVYERHLASPLGERRRETLGVAYSDRHRTLPLDGQARNSRMWQRSPSVGRPASFPVSLNLTTKTHSGSMGHPLDIAQRCDDYASRLAGVA